MASKPVVGEVLDAQTRNAVNAACDALSEWREEIAATTERHSETIASKMAAAAEALGWPDHIVEATVRQLKQGSSIQLQLIDQIMDAWRMQLKSPGAYSMLANLPPPMQGLPASGFGLPRAGIPGMESLPATPLQFWMQAAEMWQKQWTSAMEMWTGGSTRRRR